jgi:hypothetical protein
MITHDGKRTVQRETEIGRAGRGSPRSPDPTKTMERDTIIPICPLTRYAASKANNAGIRVKRL